MLIRICLIVALLGGLAVGVLNFVYVKEKITTLQANLKTETEEHQKYLGLYTKTDKELKKTSADLKQTKATLEATTGERDKAVADLAVQVKRADQLNEELTKTKQDRDAAQADLAAYKATGRTPQQILSLNQEIKGVQDNLATAIAENKLFMQKIKKLETELAVIVACADGGDDRQAPVARAPRQFHGLLRQLASQARVLRFAVARCPEL